MQNIEVFDRDWRDKGLGRTFHRAMTFTQAGLVLGRGAVLAAFAKEGVGKGWRGNGRLALEGHEARVLSLLTAAYGEPLAGGIIEKIRRAGEFWCAGDKALAQLHLAFIGLPGIDEADAYRLFLAGTALKKGVSPGELMKALGIPRAARDIEKYWEDQPRVSAGSGRESGQWTSGSGDGAGRTTYVERIDVRIIGATRSDANPAGISPGAQYAQASSPPILTPQVIKHILELHGSGKADKTKGKFTPEYSTEEAIRGLVEDAWKQATPEDLGAGSHHDSVVIGAGVSIIVDGMAEPYIIGWSGEERRAPSVPTNAYVVVIDSDNYVRSCYPINPADEINPRDE